MLGLPHLAMVLTRAHLPLTKERPEMAISKIRTKKCFMFGLGLIYSHFAWYIAQKAECLALF
jgi:hypothetical protein